MSSGCDIQRDSAAPEEGKPRWGCTGINDEQRALTEKHGAEVEKGIIHHQLWHAWRQDMPLICTRSTTVTQKSENLSLAASFQYGEWHQRKTLGPTIGCQIEGWGEKGIADAIEHQNAHADGQRGPHNLYQEMLLCQPQVPALQICLP